MKAINTSVNPNTNKPYTHDYDLDTNKGEVSVSANNRSQARSLAEKQGYKVHSVNFTG